MITSLSSLLLFNSSINAYTISRHSQLSMNRNNNSNTSTNNSRYRKAKSPGDLTDCAESTQNFVQQQQDDNLTFKLSFQSAPELLSDLPEALPSLPGIADEFQFVGGDNYESDYLNGGGGIDGGGGLNLPDLANISLMKNSKYILSDSSNSNSNSKLENFLSSPPPPPPPPPPPLMNILAEPSKAPTPPLQSQIFKKETPKEVIFSSVSPDPNRNRASLLDSIRKAGGRPIKKTIKERKHDEKLKKKEDNHEETKDDGENAGSGPSSTIHSSSNKNAPMDMMAELQKRLESRRTGISSEKRKSEGFGSNNISNNSNKSIGAQAMDNVMARIPEPVAKNFKSSSGDADDGDESDDTEGFNDDDWAD